MMLAFIPDALKERMLDVLVDFVASQGEKFFDSRFGDKIRGLSSQGAVRQAFDEALTRAFMRFQQEYVEQDEDLVADLAAVPDFWQNTEVRKALLQIVSRPRSWNADEQATVVQHFETVLPQRRNRQRVDQAVGFLLRCVAEEVWNIPAAKEIREIYALQTQRVSAEALQRQVALLEANLHATTQISGDIREALLQLVQAQQRQLLSTSAEPAALPPPRPWDNLPQPHYARFVGRERELAWLRQRLSPQDRAWQVLIIGIGGVGKSALAQAVAYEYHDRYAELLPEERFESIVWVSAKEEVLTASGHESAAPRGLIFRTLDDVYVAIAQVLRRDDLTRASLGERDRLIQGALAEQRTLLVIDNFESVTDERVRSFLRNLPPPTKALITSREWIDTAAVLRLSGLDEHEAAALVSAEAEARAITIGPAQSHRLVERTSGLPLPIRLSVARLGAGESFDAVARWLGDAAGDLPAYCVRSQIDLLHTRSSHAWKLLLTCSLFDRTAGAAREALGQIADCSLADRDDGLALLLRFSLVNQTDDDRFLLLPLVKGYARTLLQGAAEGEQIIERWMAWLITFAQANGQELELHIDRVSLLGAEYGNLRGAIAWCQEQARWVDLVRLVEGTWFYPYLVGPHNEAREMLQLGLYAAEMSNDLRSQGRFESHLGRVIWWYDTSAAQHLDRAEELLSQAKDDVTLGYLKTVRANLLYGQGRLEESATQSQMALEIGNQHNDARLQALSMIRLALVAIKSANFSEASHWLDQAEQIARSIGWSRALAWILYDRAEALVEQGSLLEAERQLYESIKLATEWNDYPILANGHRLLATIYLTTERIGLAQRAAEEARALFLRLGRVPEVAAMDSWLARFKGDVDLLNQLLTS